MKNKISFNCLSSEKEKSRIDLIMSTWGKHTDDLIFYSDFDDGEKIRKYSSDGTKAGNEEKIVNRIKELKIDNNYEWYFFIDDDTFVNLSSLYDFVEHADSNYVYGSMDGSAGQTWGHIIYPQGGAGILFNKNILDKIQPDTIHVRNSTYSDVLFGQIAKDNGLSYSWRNDLFLANSLNVPNLSDDAIKKIITFHRSIEHMPLLYSKIYK